MIEQALIKAYRSYLGNNPPPIEVTVKLDPVSGEAQVFAEKQVVDDVLDDRLEIDIADAKKIRSNVELGETVLVEFDAARFWPYRGPDCQAGRAPTHLRGGAR